MLFNSPIFLFAFLPLTLLAYFAAGNRLRNGLLLVASWIFYAWGEPRYFPLFLLSILINYGFGRWIGRRLDGPSSPRLPTNLAVAFNLILLLVFKYGYFLLFNLDLAGATIGLRVPTPLLEYFQTLSRLLPLGVSFYTFQSISYILDVSKKLVPAERSLFKLALYLSLFPELISGPIVRYRDLRSQIDERRLSLDNLVSGIRRFILGLAKVILIAAPLGSVANHIFDAPVNRLSFSLAWLGAVSFMLQIYFDFSGYSDMAIALAQMFGFKLSENFNYPYTSESITDFWRRWHISLSNWFRDYVYFPLERRKRGLSLAERYLNILIVFTLTGLWHGANWTFLVWGLIQGIFIVLERIKISEWLDRLWPPVRRLYSLPIILISWVFFRSADLNQALTYLRIMAGVLRPLRVNSTIYTYLTNEVWLALFLGVLFAFPIYPWLLSYRDRLDSTRFAGRVQAWAFDLTISGGVIVLFVGLIALLASSTVNAFIYFRF
jgi:alginate O-acetyltransferase complex protein AlgI